MKQTNYPGINYAAGTTANTDPKTGIHYGVIHQNKLGEFAFDEISNNGEDVDYLEFIQGIKDGLRSALKDYFSDYGRDSGHETKEPSKLDDAVSNAFDAISDDLDYQQSGDCTRYHYEKDGLVFDVASDGDIFVTKSPVVTYAQFCSPCAPGACYLTSPLSGPPSEHLGNCCYCLPADWFDDDQAPYPIHEINPETGELIP